MKTFLLFAGVACAIPFYCPAATINPCSMGTLASYISLASGCTVNDQQFFGFSSLAPSAGTTSNLSAGNIIVTPITSSMPGLLFTLNENASGSQLVDAAIGFDVAPAMGSANVLGGSKLTQNGGAAALTGGVVGVEMICLGGAITPAGACTAALASRNLGTFSVDGLAQATDMLTFLKTYSLLGINANFSAGGGGAGTASVTSFAIQFTTTPAPEPATFLGCACGLLCLGFVRRRQRKSIQQGALNE